MKYLYILALALTLSACAQSNEVHYDNPNTGNQTSGPKSWSRADLPLTIYVPVEMNAHKVSIQKAAQTWELAMGTPVFTFVFDDSSKPNTQYSGGSPYASLEDSYSGLFKQLTWSFPGTAKYKYLDKVANNVLAFTGTMSSNGRITKADILFNFRSADGSTGYRFGDVDVDVTQIDFESVLAHELGHFLGLGHVGAEFDIKESCTDTDYSIMCATITNGAKRRNTSAGDVSRVRALYPTP